VTRMLRLYRHKFLLFVIVAFTLSIGVASASASAEIEGVWSFNGGEVDIQAQPGGTYRGVVVAPTTFAACSHSVNQEMWSDIRQQPDGSYWGLHQWYFEPPQCLLNPTLGLTAWRVLTDPSGERYVRVCFSSPESGQQPTIAPNGVAANATYECENSTAIAPLPGKTGSKAFGKSVILPSAKKCVQNRSLLIKLQNPKYDPFKEAVVWVKGKKVADVRNIKKLEKGIRLKHLPSGAYTIRVLAVTVLNHKLTGSRRYKGCLPASGRLKLEGVGKKHRSRKQKAGK